MQKEVIIFEDKFTKINTKLNCIEYLENYEGVLDFNNNDEIPIKSNFKRKHKKILHLIKDNKDYYIVFKNDFIHSLMENSGLNYLEIVKLKNIIKKKVNENVILYNENVDLKNKLKKIKSNWLVKFLIKVKIIKDV